MSGDIRDARLCDHDPLTGLTEYYYYDPDTEGFSIETRQDVEAIVETNKALWNAREKHTPYGEMTRIASVPWTIILELSKQGIVSPTGTILDDARYRAWLNDRDNRVFRVRPGRV